MSDPIIASSITNLTYREEAEPTLSATRATLRREPDGVRTETATLTSTVVRLLLAQTPTQLDLQDAPLVTLLAFLGDAVHNEFDPRTVVDTRLNLVDALTGEPIHRAHVTAEAGDRTLASADVHEYSRGHARLVTPMCLQARVQIRADGYPPMHLDLALLKDREITLRLRPLQTPTLTPEHRAWLLARLTEYETNIVNRSCAPNAAKLEEAKTALSVALHAARAALQAAETASVQPDDSELEEIEPLTTTLLEVR